MNSFRSFLFRSLARKRPLRFFSGAQEKEQARKPEAEHEKEESKTNDSEYDNQEGYESYNERSPLSKFLRFIGYSSMSLIVLQSYFAYQDNYSPEISKLRLLYFSFFYNMIVRARQGIYNAYDAMLSPPIKKFLPDEPPLNPMLLQKVLVINLDGTLVSKYFEAGNGLMLHLRPDLMNFLQEVSKYYEIVLYTNDDFVFLMDLVATLDPTQKYFRWAFGREYMSYEGSKLIKELKYLNRNLKRLVVVDFDENLYSEEGKNNLIKVPFYDGREKDEELVHLKRFLVYLAKKEIKDIRPEIKKFGGLDSLEKFKAEYQKKLDHFNKSKSMLMKGPMSK